MSHLLSPTIRALGLTIVSVSLAGAQAPKACEVNESRPTAVGRALLAVQIASGAQDPNAASKQLTSAVKSLTENAERMENQVGRNFVLGKALVIWSTQPNVELVTKRGPLGYTVNPEGTIDLAAAIDTAFKVVEAAMPECIAETSRWRGQKAWVTLVNTAIEKLNSDDVAAAESLSSKAILLNPFGPYGYVVLANVQQKKGKGSEAISLYRKSIDAAKADTAYDDIKRQSLVYLGNLAADSAEGAADAAARKPYLEAAREAFNQIIADKDAADIKESARSGLCRVAIAAGDTGSLRGTYKPQLDAAAGFQYGELMNAGVCMARAEMVPEATLLFKAAYEKNPYHRDALSNLAIMLLRMDNHIEALPLATRLVEVEPNNPENLQLLVLANAGIAKSARDARMAGSKTATPATKTAAKTKAPTTTKAAAPAGPRMSAAAQDSLFKIEQQYTEVAVSTNERKEKLSYKVSLSDFSTTAAKATVAGSVTNVGTAVKPVTVSVDFLDRTGKVVATKEQALGEIAAGRSARFSLTHNPGSEVAAFRYKRID
ncbi:MAG: FxLYD domain-containing protein [Gemmatimonadaceae bacterium]